MNEHEGIMISTHPDTGEIVVTKWQLPLDFGGSLFGWVQDFFRVLEEFSKFRLWILRLVLGRYGYRELIGMFDDLKKHGDWTPEIGYGLEGTDYNKEKVKLVFPSWEEMYND